MVAANAKRKKAADMADSPPKRVTRARAAKGRDDSAPAEVKITKITTASTKAAAAKKKPAASAKSEASAKASKRKTKTTGREVAEAREPAEEPIPSVAPDTKQTRAKGRQQAAKIAEKPGIQAVEAPKTRSHPVAVKSTENARPDPPKTRGRPKKEYDEAPEVPPTKEHDVSKAAKKTTRVQVAASAKPSVTAKTSMQRAPAPRKKVTFEEDKDKENIPLEMPGLEKPGLKPTGLKAKPVRKPVVARAITRSRAATPATVNKVETSEKNQVMPLSPKKVNQVARSDTISEDELAGEKTPTRALSNSPAKRFSSPIKDLGAIPYPDFSPHRLILSPTKQMSSSILLSPARRPPPSPFKDALKYSPKKPSDGESFMQPATTSSRTPLKTSLMQESPKRGLIVNSAMKPVMSSSQASFKASLLQSPARRRVASPMKSAPNHSPSKSSRASPDSDIAASPRKVSPIKSLTMWPQEFASSPLRNVKSPEHGFRVHTITESERKASETDEQFEQIATSPETESMTAEVQTKHDIPEEQAKLIDSMSPEGYTSTMDTDVDRNETTRDISPTMAVAPAFSIDSTALRRTTILSDLSEDELASPQKIYGKTPVKDFGGSGQNIGTPASDGEVVPAPNSNISFTPLADQLSSWNTSSPYPQDQTRRARGLFSLGGEVINPILEQTDSTMVNSSQAKSSFFDDEMAMHNDHDGSTIMEADENREQDLAALRVSLDSQASEEYGDENAVPDEAEMIRAEQDQNQTVTCTPAKVFTPARMIQRPQETHTVCKVPLRPSAEESPLKVPRQRSRSFGGPLAPVIAPRFTNIKEVVALQPATSVLTVTIAPQTPSSGMRLDAEIPGRTVRKGIMPDVLKGAVVHVDVHTTEGADASGIFVDLLTQMGARCLKQWNWNPHTSSGGSLISNASPQGPSPDPLGDKIGITHVVYKDGGKRTLEKVRDSKGAVHCVGVGWVLE